MKSGCHVRRLECKQVAHFLHRQLRFSAIDNVCDVLGFMDHEYEVDGYDEDVLYDSLRNVKSGAPTTTMEVHLGRMSGDLS
jgi:hypothetical protein